MMALAQAVSALADHGPCRLLGDGATVFETVSIDTRTLAAGALYVALRGERYDGHDFAGAAAQGGAVALLVERVVPAASPPQIVVPDTHVALGQLAAAWRERCTVPVIAVTGSNGKTTTTQMIAAVLAKAYGERDGRPCWFATRGNRNNEIGVPLMLLELRPEHRAAVLELGMNHPGEIERLAAWARPDVALVTNAQREHQEFLDSVAATAHENGAVIAALPAGGTAVFPADDDCAAIWRERAGTRRIVDFAIGGAAAVRAEVELGSQRCGLHLRTPVGPIDIELQVAGLHNARNALAASAACIAAGVVPAAIAAGLAAFVPVAGRGTRRRCASGALLIDESYNANPDSVRAAIDLLAQQQGVRVLVLGDMGEVGTRGPEFHDEVGEYARERGIDRLLALGEQSALAALAFGAGAQHFSTIDALIEAARAATLVPTRDGPPVTILIKGSRFMRLERVVAALVPAATGAAAGAGHGSEHRA
jgi:UDP-N-acetylmuramoyl-tripeptide--D-alanyl-D-alanine ligase